MRGLGSVNPYHFRVGGQLKKKKNDEDQKNGMDSNVLLFNHTLLKKLFHAVRFVVHRFESS